MKQRPLIYEELPQFTAGISEILVDIQKVVI